MQALLCEGSWSGGRHHLEDEILLPNLLPADFVPVLDVDCAAPMLPAAVVPEPRQWPAAFMMTDITTHEARIIQASPEPPLSLSHPVSMNPSSLNHTMT